MRAPRIQPTSPAVLWFGVLAAPAAWGTQHVAGFAFTQAACNLAGQVVWDIPFDALTIGTTAAGFVVAMLGLAASVLAFRATPDPGTEPPAARIHFMATIGIVVSPLLALIIVMSGLGALFLPECQQG